MEETKNDFRQSNILSLLIYLFIAMLFLSAFTITKGYKILIMDSIMVIWIASQFKKNNIKTKLVVGKVKSFKELGLLSALSSIIAVSLILMMFKILSITQSLNLESYENDVMSINLILKNINAVIIAPFIEEFIFRGYLINKLHEKYTLGKCIIISTLLFSILHLESFLGVMLLGFFVSIIYVKTKCLYSSIICHSIYNFVITILCSSLGYGYIEILIKNSSLFLIVSIPIITYYLYKNWIKIRTISNSPYYENKSYDVHETLHK